MVFAKRGQPPNQIRFVMTATNVRPFVIPADIARHPLVAMRDFYTFPERLFNLIVQGLGHERFDGQLLELERRLSRLVGDHALNVGIRREGLIAYGFLVPSRPLTIRYEDVKDLGWGKSPAEIKEIERIGNERLQALEESTRGYCGWLLTDRTFLDEHDGLIRQHRNRLLDHDFPRPVLASFGRPLPQSRSDEPWVGAFRACYGRWRLQSLAASGLPMPLPVLVPALPQVARNLAAAEGGTTVFVPDIVPVSTRGVLVKTIRDAVHGGQQPKHLAEWLHIVGTENTAKNAIARDGRLFRLQHYWRIVQARHPDAVRRNTERLRSAFGEFFNVSDDSIRKDLTLIARRLGKGWERRPDPLA